MRLNKYVVILIILAIGANLVLINIFEQGALAYTVAILLLIAAAFCTKIGTKEKQE
ncbi:MAG: hypothetical protein ABF649_14070 [Bacillus sp. (in: firmicutes)]